MLPGRRQGPRQHYREAFDGRPTVLVEVDVAVVWTRYVFEIDGESSHTGTRRLRNGWNLSLAGRELELAL